MSSSPAFSPRRPGRGPATVPRPRGGLSLLELIAALTLLGVLAAVVVPRLGVAARHVDVESCERCRETIDVHAALHRRNVGAWPQADLSDLAASLPEGLPVCPVDGTAYTFDAATGRTVPHGH
ncbi:type II secretion system protein [Alienimonas sp. DA493]|uniref:type II secretion system protein n=1 Tax=Alienimonas sp. DA493 TaxID=3373605 RepID=UPI003754986E